MEYNSSKIRATDSHLLIHFTAKHGTAIRFDTVKVPLKEIAMHPAVMEGLERATRRALIEHWSGMELPDTPLF